MYTLGIRDHLEVLSAASPAPHFGITWAVCVEVSREELGPGGVVVDASLLRRALRGVLEEIDHLHLDSHPAFHGRRATPELVARHVHREVGRRLPVNLAVTLKVSLEESSAAWARYEAPLQASGG